MKTPATTRSPRRLISSTALLLAVAAFSSADAQSFEDGFEPLADGDCTLVDTEMKMWWSSCDDSLDCFVAVDESDGQTHRWLRLPSTGPVVREAHLVTTGETFSEDWPVSGTDGINNHYAVSESASGYVMNRTEPWAPAGEGGSEWGQGATGAKVPALDEAWYITMNWRERPAKGARMIVKNPANGRAVVVSAGYETGPGSNSDIAGVPEEVHHYLGSAHRSPLVVGFALFQELALGPISCP